MIRNISRLGGELFSRYGMLLVLIILVIFFSIITLEEQSPEGDNAARRLAKELRSDAAGATYLVVTRESPEDLRFATALKEELSGHSTVQAISGNPAAIREGLANAVANQGVPTALVTTSGSQSIVLSVQDRIPELKGTAIRTPQGYRWPTFLLSSNILNIANQISVIAIIAAGMTIVILTAGIDLSVGSLIAFSAVIATALIRHWGGPEASTSAMIFGSLVGISLCGLIGSLSGVAITTFRLPPFIATLSVMLIASGMAYIVSSGRPIHEIPDSYVWLGRGATPWLGVPYAVILMLLVYLVGHVLMGHTVFGRAVYGIGGNIEAARLSGIRVQRVLISVYALSGAMAGLGGIVMASQLKSGAPTYGNMYELYVIAAVVVGGTSLSGGEGRVGGTLIGAFIIAVIWNGMNLMGIESYAQKVILGSVILGSVLLDRMKHLGWSNFRRIIGKR